MSLTFDRNRFFQDWSARTNLALTPTKRSALGLLLDNLEQDKEFTMVRELSYVLATIRWETAHSFKPIREKRCNRASQPHLWELQNRYWQTGFYGRGYVQLTWEKNYRRAGEEFEGREFPIGNEVMRMTPQTLVESPDLAMDPNLAYAICSRGMREGWFTGKALGRFIVEGQPADYVGARQVVNGKDRAKDIADLANEFELLLRASSLGPS